MVVYFPVIAETILTFQEVLYAYLNQNIIHFYVQNVCSKRAHLFT